MNKFAVTTALTAAVVAGLVFTRPSTAETAAPKGGEIGFIDMAHVFQEYAKFKAMQKSLAAEAKTIDEGLREKVQSMQAIQKQLTGGQIAQGSPEAKKLEEQLIRMKTDMETSRQVQQRDFLRKESEIYKQVYVEVQDAVREYCKYYNKNVVFRFNRGEVDTAGSPQEILKSMNRQVVHFDKADDITDAVLGYLNKKYGNAGAGG